MRTAQSILSRDKVAMLASLEQTRLPARPLAPSETRIRAKPAAPAAMTAVVAAAAAAAVRDDVMT